MYLGTGMPIKAIYTLNIFFFAPRKARNTERSRIQESPKKHDIAANLVQPVAHIDRICI
jgi:hypothetical protein